MAMLRAAALLAAVVLAGCGGSDDEPDEAAPSPPPSTTAEPTPAPGDRLASTCENEELRLVIRYPEGWWTNPGTVAPPCRFFHPEPLDLQPASEAPPTAVSIQAVQAGVDRLVADVEQGNSVLSRDEVEVAGRTAIVLETESTGQGLYDAGTRTFAYYLPRGGGSLIVSTTDVGGLDYDANREVLERMVGTLDLGPTSMVDPPPVTTDDG